MATALAPALAGHPRPPQQPQAAASSSITGSTDDQLQQQQRKLKRLLKALDGVRGHNGTSLITLLVPPRHPLSRPAKLLAEESGAAGNIKSRVNRLSVQWALTSVQQRLKVYSRVPDNGLAIFCGTIITADGKEKKVTIDFEPCKPIPSPVYLCDARFHTESLSAMLETDERRFGFIIVDGSGALFAVVSGSNREILHRLSVDLPRKHARGGQSALRFARLRIEKRHNYLRKVAETALAVFVEPESGRVLLDGLVLAGLADFKTALLQGGLLDARLAAKVLQLIDIPYGGECGLNQAIGLASDSLAGVAYAEEKRSLNRLFELVAKDSGLVSYGTKQTLAALELGAVDTVLAWEDLPMDCVPSGTASVRPVPRGGRASDDDVIAGDQVQTEMPSGDAACGRTALVDWLAEVGCPSAGARLRLLACRSPEGVQFSAGFGGLAALLRYPVHWEDLEPGVNGEDDIRDDKSDAAVGNGGDIYDCFDLGDY